MATLGRVGGIMACFRLTCFVSGFWGGLCSELANTGCFFSSDTTVQACKPNANCMRRPLRQPWKSDRGDHKNNSKKQKAKRACHQLHMTSSTNLSTVCLIETILGRANPRRLRNPSPKLCRVQNFPGPLRESLIHSLAGRVHDRATTRVCFQRNYPQY